MALDVERLFDSADCEGSLHVVRLSSGDEIAHEADVPRVMASVVKVPIALEFFNAVEAGRVDPARRVTLAPGSRTPGPTGISALQDDVTMSLRDLAYLMLSISDNAATDAIVVEVGLAPVNRRLQEIGCHDTVVMWERLTDMLDDYAHDVGFASYAELLQAYRGEIGSVMREKAKSITSQMIEGSRVLDPLLASHTTARDATRLLAAIAARTAAAPKACDQLLSVMSQQVTRRMERAVRPGGALMAKTGALFGRVRNEVALIQDPDGEMYAAAVFTVAHRRDASVAAVSDAMSLAVADAVDALRPRDQGRET